MIRKPWFILPSILCSSICFAQTNQEVVKAELDFASTAKTKSMKTAFLQYMDSSAVVFERGEIHNGMQFWNKSEENSGKLLWQPSFFAISASNDLGFTTGPWEYRPSLEDSVAGSGQYTTVWAKNKNGEWKFLIDLGVSYKPTMFHQQTLKKFNLSTPAERTVDILSIENKFIRDVAERGIAAYNDRLVENTWLNIDRKQPIQTSLLVLTELATLPPGMIFTPVAGGVSAARDLAYVYGTIQYEKKKENYLRIWAHTEKGWRVLLQVIKR
jgi:ketosteroid isomerase-like protein